MSRTVAVMQRLNIIRTILTNEYRICGVVLRRTNRNVPYVDVALTGYRVVYFLTTQMYGLFVPTVPQQKVQFIHPEELCKYLVNLARIINNEHHIDSGR